MAKKKKTKPGSMDDNAMARGAKRNNYLKQLEEASDTRTKREKDVDSVFDFEDEDTEEESYMD